jgi:uncharacterized membrane protein YtjA (UPF0391 family)
MNPPVAHAGHWIAQLLYLTPLIPLVVLYLVGAWRRRRERGK